VVSEYLRTWVDQHQGRVPTAAEQAAVLAGQREAEISALLQAQRNGRHWVIADSGPLMTAVYSIQYYDDHSLLPTALESVGHSDFVVWCQDDFPWQPDPQRDGSAARTRSQQILGTILAEHPELPVLIARGPLELRVKNVLRQGHERNTSRCRSLSTPPQLGIFPHNWMPRWK
jgi:nicotinamide riboside kinase